MEEIEAEGVQFESAKVAELKRVEQKSKMIEEFIQEFKWAVRTR